MRRMMVWLLLTALLVGFLPAALPSAEAEQGILTLEDFSNQVFSGRKPKGWTVDYLLLADPAVADSSNLYLRISDPENGENCVYFGYQQQPFFSTAEDKSKWVGIWNREYNTTRYDWAPILENGTTAEGVLKAWGSVFTLIQAADLDNGEKLQSMTRNYRVEKTLDGHTLGFVGDLFGSWVLAQGTIGGKKGTYKMYYMDFLLPQDSGYNLPDYYISYNNAMVVAEEALFDDYAEALVECLNSLVYNDGDNTPVLTYSMLPIR